MKQMLINPHMSEKAVAEAANATYIFDVPLDANKHEIATTISEYYSVNVTNVRTIIRKGKSIRTYRGRGKFANGSRKDSKKAYVTLAEGQTIPVFEEAS